MAKFSKEDRAGLYITVIFHLAVIIVLLATQLGFSIAKENSFVLDFTKQEAVEKAKKEEVFKEDITERIERMLAAAGSVPIRNIAVDRGALKDDRGTNAEELYRDAERLQQELDHGAPLPKDEQVYEYKKPDSGGSKKSSESNYSGPSVVSYELDGRKITSYPSEQAKLDDGSLTYLRDRVVADGNLITSRGPGTAAEFGLALLGALEGREVAEKVRVSALFP